MTGLGALAVGAAPLAGGLLLVAQEKSREFQSRTRYFTEEGHWRDIVLFVTILLFAVITWHADHHRPVWLPLFIATLVMSVIVAVAVVRGFLTSIRADDGDHDLRDGDNDPKRPR